MLTIGALALMAVVIAAVLTGLVMLRRRDFGRRRALGASRTWVAYLVLSETFCVSGIGAGIGLCASLIGYATGKFGEPDVGYFTAVTLMTVTVACCAGVVPAIVASRREPAVELRLP